MVEYPRQHISSHGAVVSNDKAFFHKNAEELKRVAIEQGVKLDIISLPQLRQEIAQRVGSRVRMVTEELETNFRAAADTDRESILVWLRDNAPLRRWRFSTFFSRVLIARSIVSVDFVESVKIGDIFEFDLDRIRPLSLEVRATIEFEVYSRKNITVSELLSGWATPDSDEDLLRYYSALEPEQHRRTISIEAEAGLEGTKLGSFRPLSATLKEEPWPESPAPMENS